MIIRRVLPCLALLLCAVLAHAQGQPPAEPTFEIRKIVIQGASLVSPQEFDALTKSFVGKDKTYADVQRVSEAIEKAYAARGYGGVQVILPEQQLEKGEIRFRVVETRVTKIAAPAVLAPALVAQSPAPTPALAAQPPASAPSRAAPVSQPATAAQSQPASTPPLLAAPVSQPAPSSQSADPRFEIRKFVIEGASLITAQEFDVLTRPFVGKDKTFADVQRALEVVEKVYGDRGYSAAQVTLPEQELDKGEVKLRVIEAHIGKIIVEGNKNFNEENIRASLPTLKEGQAPNTHEIAHNLKLANENPNKQTTVLMRGGQEEAQVDAVVRVSDEPALKYSFTADNTGTQQTGNFRVGVGFQHSNLTNHDDILSMQYVTGPNDDKVPDHLQPYPSKAVFIVGGAYKIPLYELGDSFEISSGYSNVNSGVVANLFNISGSGTIFGLRYNHNLRRSGDLDHKIALSWDWRAYHSMVNQADTGGPSLVPDVTVQPLGLTYSGNYRAAVHETSFYFSWYQNMPSENDAGQQAFDASRVGADAHYTLQRYGINHNRSFANDMQFRIGFSGQYTRNKLVAGEMWGIGGADSVRGFLEREIINDWGYRGSVEMYSPDFASKIPDVSNGTRMRALIFYDWGLAQRNAPTAAEVAGQHIASFGLGFRISSGTNMFTRIDYGVVLDPGGVQGRWDGRVHASFSYLF